MKRLTRVFRREPLPDDVAAMELGPRERILGWAECTGDHRGFVVTTNLAVTLTGGARIPYDRVIRAGWDDPVLEMVVQMASGTPTDTLRLILGASASGAVPVVVRDRVTASIAAQRHVPLLQDGKGAQLVARKDPATQAIRWAVVFDSGVDSRDPEIRIAADEALANLRSSLGL
jgi:hypothetical protein